MFSRASERIPGYKWYAAGGVTESNLTVRWDQSEQRLLPGDLFDDDLSVVAVDGATDIFETGGEIAAAMDGDTYRVSKANKTASYHPNTPLLLVDRPTTAGWDEYESWVEQNPFAGWPHARLDAVVLGDRFAAKQDAVNSPESSVGAISASPPSATTLSSHLGRAWKMKPDLTEEAQDQINSTIKELNEWRKEQEETGNYERGHFAPLERWLRGHGHESIARFAEASARAHHRVEVTEADVEIARSVIEGSFEEHGYDFDSGKLDGFDDDRNWRFFSEGISSERQITTNIQKAIDILNEENDRGDAGPSVEDIAGLVNEDEDKVRHHLQKLQTNGKVYVPMEGGWKNV